MSSQIQSQSSMNYGLLYLSEGAKKHRRLRKSLYQNQEPLRHNNNRTAQESILRKCWGN